MNTQVAPKIAAPELEETRTRKPDAGTYYRTRSLLSAYIVFVGFTVLGILIVNWYSLSVIHAALPQSLAADPIQRVFLKLIGAELLAVLLISLAGYLIYRRINLPLARMRRGANRYARGIFSQPLPRSGIREIDELASAMNGMAVRLDQSINNLISQRDQQNAVFSSMTEGVLVLGLDGVVISCNAAARELLDINPQGVGVRLIDQMSPADRARNFILRATGAREPFEEELLTDDGWRQFLHLRAVTVKDRFDRPFGVLVVVTNVTRLKRLEAIRKDFVANVSHELKTPITLIKGFIETLIDGAMREPEDAERFLRILAVQANRLNKIVEDLLTLARLEEKRQTEFLREESVSEILHSALEVCQVRADTKNIRLQLECPPELLATLDRSLIEQAVINLIDNAISYGPSDSTVRVQGLETPGGVTIIVADQGPGIAAEHRSRIFERFYRVDKSRSRNQGGTGLGLAIVKHVATVHKGSIDVESAPGSGSRFSLHLPHVVEDFESPLTVP